MTTAASIAEPERNQFPMTDPIVLLVDYKSQFGSKYVAEPYRSGMELKRLGEYFEEAGFRLEVLRFSDVDFRRREWSGVPVVYTSSEDESGRYKSFIEDIVLGLELAGAHVIPAHRMLRAHNNKVFMEILRDLTKTDEFGGIESTYFGALEEWERIGDGKARTVAGGKAPSPTVVKPAAGALSRGVGLASDRAGLRAKIRAISRTPSLGHDLWDLVRSIRRPGYVRESRNRGKFITQTFIGGLDHDWKVLVYGCRFYAIRRDNRENDFRASGGGRLTYVRELPSGLLDFAESVRRQLDVPHVSLDIGWTDTRFVLFEFQALHFGTYTIDHSPFHFVRGNEGWATIEGPSELERAYVESIARYLRPSTP